MSGFWAELNEIKTTLREIRRELRELKDREIAGSIEEISVNKARRLLGVGSDKVVELIKSGELKARPIYRGSIKTYKIRVAEIREFQRRKETPRKEEPREPVNAKEIFLRIRKQVVGV